MEPKLLTEAEWRKVLLGHQFDIHEPMLRERGLIAPEPVDPLLIEAREIVASRRGYNEHVRECCLNGTWDGSEIVQVTLAALKRGIELAERPPLTREMVVAAWEHYSCHGPYGVDGLHAALQEQLKEAGRET